MTGYKNRHWTDDEIIKGLRALNGRGVPMTYNGVGVIDDSLLQASVSHFGTLPKALVVANLPPPPKGKIWNEKKVIREIKRLYKEGVDLSVSRLAFSHSGLLEAGRKYCGSWDSAMSLAGISSENYRRRLEGPKPRLSKEDVIDRLNELNKQGVEMSIRGVGAADRKLYRAILKHFKDLESALEEGGLEFVPYPRRLTWTEEKVIQEIGKLLALGEELSHNIVKRKHPDLVYGAKKHYGTWTKALTMAGIDPTSVRKRPKSTDEELLKELRRLHKNGKPVNAWALRKINSGLATTLRARWGSHDAALRAAGLDPEKIRLK
jgi:hypothetical protein